MNFKYFVILEVTTLNNNKKMNKLLLSLLFVVAFTAAFAQNELSRLQVNLQKAQNDTTRVLVYRDLMKYYLYNNPDSSELYKIKAKDLALKINYKQGVALIDILDAINLENQGNFDEAKKILNRSLEVFYHNDYDKGIATTYNQLGVIEAKQSNYKIATNYFLRALTIYERNNDTLGIVQSYLKLGVVNIYIQNFNKSLYFFNTALKLNNGKSFDAELNIYNNIATIYGQQRDFKNAIKFLELAKNKSEKQGGNRAAPHIYLNLGNAYSQLKNKKLASKNYQIALELSKEFNILEDEGRVYFNMALLYEDHEVDKTIEMILKGLDIAKKLNNVNMQEEMYDELYKSYAIKGDYKSAYNALNEYHAIKDSLYSDERKKDVELLQAEYEITKSKSEVKELEFLYNQKKFRNIIYIVLIVAAIIIIIIIAYGSNQRKKLNNQLVNSLHIREKLLSIIAHDLRSPVNNVIGIVDLFDTGTLSEIEKKELLATLKKHVLLTLDTLDTILKWGQTQLRGIVVNKVKLNINNVINKNIELLSLTAKQKSIKLSNVSNYTADVIFDDDHINFILRNLISNAIKFSRVNTEIIIDAENIDHYLRISIKDSGLGMDQKIINSLFTTNQIVKYGTENEKGSGLGLLLCREFIEANGGKIEVISELNVGSTFYVYILL